MQVDIPISVGELVDKITILEIKNEKIKDNQKLEKINLELKLLKNNFEKQCKLNSQKLLSLKKQLKIINLKLWNIEDEIRILESKKQFDLEFINLARLVYKTNDERFEIKNKINNLFSSNLSEVKSYEKY